jgi:predicted ABC-class ATPase
MKDKQDFFSLLGQLDGLDAAEYSRVLGDFDFGRYILRVNRVAMAEDPQGSLFLIRVPQQIAGFPHHLLSSPVRRTALEDYLIRQVSSALEQHARFDEDGLARRRISIAAPGQKILPRTALVVTDEFVEARLYINLPLQGGKIESEEIYRVFFEDLPQVVNQGVLFCNLDAAAVERFVDVMEDADQIRQMLPTLGLVAFTGAGSLPGRAAGGDLPDPDARPITAAPELLRSIEVPNAKSAQGLCIPSGITLVLGDEYSGRREWMKALASGIYNHVPGDGREFVVAVPDAVYVSAQPGRSVQRVNLSAFVSEEALPGCSAYSARSADAFTSQAASLVEAVEVGARVLFLDESESSPAFLGRDARFAPVLPGSARHRSSPTSPAAWWTTSASPWSWAARPPSPSSCPPPTSSCWSRTAWSATPPARSRTPSARPPRPPPPPWPAWPSRTAG